MPSISQAKIEYEERMNEMFDKYSCVLFCNMDNVRSQQVHDVRRGLRGKAELLMGKKTMQQKIVENRSKNENATKNDVTFNSKCCELNLLTLNSGLVFTNEPINEICAIFDKNRVQAPARVGAIAPCDVVVPAGNTGMEPTQTSFFQALSIPTKIAKGTVEIISDKKVLSTGDKVDNSTAVLLQKLKISPFYYQMEVTSVWDRGVVFTAEDLAITEDSIEKLFVEGIQNMTALSLGAGIPTASSVPLMVTEAFKSLLAVSVETEYEFPEYNGAKLRSDAKEGKLGGGAAAPAAAAAAAAPAAAAPVEEEDEDEDDGFGSLF